MRRRHKAILLASCALALALSWWRGAYVHERAGPAAAASHSAGSARRIDAATVAPRPRSAATGVDTAGEQASVQQCVRDYNRAIEARLGALATVDDARTQLARSLLLSLVEGAGQPSDAALARAVALAPTDPLVARVVYARCGAGCDRAAAAAHLAAIDPDDMAGRLAQLEVAYQQEDAKGIARALSSAARAQRFEEHFGETAAGMAAVLEQVPWPGSCRASASKHGHALGLQRAATRMDDIVLRATAISAAALPTYAAVSRACAAQALALLPDREADCLAVMARMARSDTLARRLPALTQLAAATTARAEGAQWREQLRQLDYLLAQRLALDPASVAVGWEVGEIPAMQARLRELHRWPPPRHWLPPGLRARSPVTGTPPSGTR